MYEGVHSASLDSVSAGHIRDRGNSDIDPHTPSSAVLGRHGGGMARLNPRGHPDRSNRLKPTHHLDLHKADVVASQFPDVLQSRKGKEIRKPPRW
jgi:hypothetical protein